jgi:hypothetical protein
MIIAQEGREGNPGNRLQGQPGESGSHTAVSVAIAVGGQPVLDAGGQDLKGASLNLQQQLPFFGAQFEAMVKVSGLYGPGGIPEQCLSEAAIDDGSREQLV